MTDKSKKKPTSFDVARLAGVHRSAVSRAFSGRGRMADDTRKKVLAAAEQLGYRVNFLARGLQGSSSQLVGIVASRLDTPYRATQVKILARELLFDGYHPILVTAEGGDDLTGLMEGLLNYSVSGMIITSDTPPSALIEECAALSVPVVLINRDSGVKDADRVQMDIRDSGQLAFDTLRSCGGRRFAVLIPQTQTYSVAGRAEEFARCCDTAGLSLQRILVAGQDYDDGLRAADYLAALKDRPDAVFGTTDLLAIGFLDGLRHRHGIQVPQEVQVLGFDDIPQASWLGNDLSTLGQDAEQAAQTAVQLMLERIQAPGRAFETQTIRVLPRLRNTTRSTDGDRPKKRQE